MRRGAGLAHVRGLLRIPLKHFFTATSALVLLLAAGMASQAARFLIQANVLPSLASPLWDTSAVVSNSSVDGQGAAGPRWATTRNPPGCRSIFFVAVFAAILIGMGWAKRRLQQPATS